MNTKQYLIKIVFILQLISLSAWGETTLKIFTLQHRFAEDLIPLVTPMVGDYGAVTGMNNQLIVRANENTLSEIEQLIQQLDRARENRRITVATNQTSNQTQNSVETRARLNTGQVNIQNKRYGPNGVTINIDNRTTNISAQNLQFINVLDGERAFIRIGQLVPFNQTWAILTQRYAQVFSVTDWLEITTGFAVRPRSIGNHIELEITPRISKLNSNEFIDFNELSTVINTRQGEWVELSQIMEQNDAVSQQILGFNRNQESHFHTLKVKVD